LLGLLFWIGCLQRLSALNALGAYRWLDCVAFFAFYNQLAATVLAVVAEESGFSTFWAAD
jgi:hypothetical protein